MSEPDNTERRDRPPRAVVHARRPRSEPAAFAQLQPTAPVILTAEQVLEAARAHGVPAFSCAGRERLVLLASIRGYT